MMQEDSNGESTFEFVEGGKGARPKTNKGASAASGPMPTPALPLSVVSLSSTPPSQMQPAPPAPPPSTVDFGTAHPSGGSARLMDWFGGGLLSKVAEKAQNSVQSVITTLDPQMREFIYSGGDIDIVVASDKEAKVSPIREGFQSTFGKATVRGMAAQAPTMAAQPVGFVAGVKGAEERIHCLRSGSDLEEGQVVVASEGFLVEATQDRWFEASALVLSDPAKGVTLQTYTQLTPVPLEWVTQAQEDTPSDYPMRWAGLGVTVGEIAAKRLQVPHWQWHEALTGVTRRDMILIAARTLAGLYKSALKV